MANYKTGQGNYRSSFIHTVRQEGDLTVNNSTTLVDTDLITQTLKVGRSYEIQVWFAIASGTTPDSKLQPTLTTLVATRTGWNVSVPAGHIYTATVGTSNSVDGAGSTVLGYLSVIILDVTTAGTVKIQFAQQTAEASATSFKKGSCMLVTELF